jgi:hypothetical protein
VDTTTPTHADCLHVWSGVCKQINNEAVVLILPIEKGIAATAFQPNDQRGLEDFMEDSIHTLMDNGAVTQECPWAALVAPSFTCTVPAAEAPMQGDLQARYAAGDETVREIVVVIIMEMDQPPVGCSFTQPLLEPLDEPNIMAPGPMTVALMSVLMHAAFREDFTRE